MNRWPICGLWMTSLLRAPALVCFALTTLLSSPVLSQTQSCSSNPPFQEIYGCWDDFMPTDGIEAIHAVLVPVNVSGARVGMVLMWHWTSIVNGTPVNQTRLW